MHNQIKNTLKEIKTPKVPSKVKEGQLYLIPNNIPKGLEHISEIYKL